MQEAGARHKPSHLGSHADHPPSASDNLVRPRPDPVGPGQESVWAYPRPAIAEPTARHIVLARGGATIADTRAAVRTLETSHPPTYYLPPDDVARARLIASDHRSFCEWKGVASYWHLDTLEGRLANVAWSYPDPTPAFRALADHLAFYARPFEATVDGVSVTPQPGGFYGGWITPDLGGPFKGVPGSRFW